MANVIASKWSVYTCKISVIVISFIHSKLCWAGVFDLLTKTYMRSTKKDKPGVDVAVAAGITSACLAQVLSFPLETVARRLQVASFITHSFAASSKVLYVPEHHAYADLVSASTMPACAML